MSGNKRKNPNIEDFVRKNATLIAKHAEENPNKAVVDQLYPPLMYKCKNCDKKYDNFQALGGHRASHRRSSLKTATSETDSEIKKHECRICGDGFAIGQALGGHMRKHWVPKVAKKEEEKKVLCHGNKNLGNIKNSKIAMVVPYDHDYCSSSSVTSNSNGKKVFAYDLNLTPCENEELKKGDRSDNGSFSEAS